MAKFNLFVVYLIGVLICKFYVVVGYNIFTKQKSKFSLSFKSMHPILKSAIAVVVTSQMSLFPSYGDSQSPAIAIISNSYDEMANVGSIAPDDNREIQSSEEKIRVAKKAMLQAKAREDETFVGSMLKEKAKQESRKKSKSARSADLCEVLGRGC